MLSKMLQLIFILIFTLPGQSQPDAYKIPQSEIEKKVYSYINKSLENTTIIKHEIVNLRIPTNLLVTDKNYVMYIKRNIVTPPKGNTTLLLHISVDGEIIKSSSVTCKVKTWEKAFRAGAPIKSGNIIQKENILTDTLETTTLRKGYATSINQILNNVAVRTIRINDVFYLRNLKQPPVINKGEQIDLVYDNGLIKVVVRAKALCDGTRGEYIWVKNLQSGKRLKAVVVKAGEVQIK